MRPPSKPISWNGCAAGRRMLTFFPNPAGSESVINALNTIQGKYGR